MKHQQLFIAVGITVMSLLVASCAPAATATPAPTQIPATPTPIVIEVTSTPVPVPTATAAPTPLATVPDGALVQKGKLFICTDFPYPPQELFDENGNPQGSDVDIGTEIANRLGLQVKFVNTVFDFIIPALAAGKCDIIISAQNITADRQKQVNMIPYFQAGQTFVAQKGNPQNINGPADLCGKSAAAESGTTEADYLQGTGDYKTSGGLTQACTKAGKPPINVVVTQKDTDALQQLQAGKVAVYFADTPPAAYYTLQQPDQFQLVGQVLQAAVEGISVLCGQSDCTNAPLTPLGQAVKAALTSMMQDGTYQKILAKWNLTSGAISP